MHHTRGYIGLGNIVPLLGLGFLCIIATIILRCFVYLAVKYSLLKRENLEKFLGWLAAGSALILLVLVVAGLLLGGGLTLNLRSSPGTVLLGLFALGVLLSFPASVLLWFGHKFKVPPLYFPP